MMEIPFEHLSAAHCENGVTGNLLRFYGYDYSEPLIFGLSASLYFVHLPFVHLAGFPVTSFRPLSLLVLPACWASRSVGQFSSVRSMRKRN